MWPARLFLSLQLVRFHTFTCTFGRYRMQKYVSRHVRWEEGHKGNEDSWQAHWVMLSLAKYSTQDDARKKRWAPQTSRVCKAACVTRQEQQAIGSIVTTVTRRFRLHSNWSTQDRPLPYNLT